MVSEGVDIPRLRVGVYATTARTELFFRQVVGRFIRRSPAPRHQMSHLFLPSDLTLKVLAGRIEEERNHAIELKPLLADGELDEPPDRVASEPGAMFEALSSDARPDEEISLRTLPGENLQLFGEPDSAPSAAYIAFTGGPSERSGGCRRPSGKEAADEACIAREEAMTPPGGMPAPPAYEQRERLRAERSKLVSQRARVTGEPHRTINARINRATGARSVGDATLEQLTRANELLRRELG